MTLGGLIASVCLEALFYQLLYTLAFNMAYISDPEPT
jgi:predicted DNA-binding ribbon-helix-helix protein